MGVSSTFGSILDSFTAIGNTLTDSIAKSPIGTEIQKTGLFAPTTTAKTTEGLTTQAKLNIFTTVTSMIGNIFGKRETDIRDAGISPTPVQPFLSSSTLLLVGAVALGVLAVKVL